MSPAARMRRSTPSPSVPGSMMSSTTRSGRWSCSHASAADPSPSSWTRSPSRRRYSATTSRTIGSSSTTSTSAGSAATARQYDRRRTAGTGPAGVSRSFRISFGRCHPRTRTVANHGGDHHLPARRPALGGRAERHRGGRGGARRRRAGVLVDQLGADPGDSGRHPVHRPLRGVPQGHRRLPLRHERQDGAGGRHRRRVAAAGGRPRPGRGPAAVGRCRRLRRLRSRRRVVAGHRSAG